MPKLKELEKFFCEAMAHGWASGLEGRQIVRDGWRKCSYENKNDFPDLYLEDCWGRDPSSKKPSGQTIIYEEKSPVWVMWYGGELYKQEALPLLKSALIKNYSKNIFLGGRGPRWLEDTGKVYMNGCTGNFVQFKGTELIVDENFDEGEEGYSLGSHSYWGGSLVYLE
jgi:hypothetical protein